MRIVSIDEFRGGLNNQKMILAGCFFLAKELGAKVALPGDIVNFIPTAHGYKRYPLKFKEILQNPPQCLVHVSMQWHPHRP